MHISASFPSAPHGGAHTADVFELKLQLPWYGPVVIAKHPLTFVSGLGPVYVRFAARMQASSHRFSGTLTSPWRMHDVVGGFTMNELDGSGGVIG